jgi:hypothetical protein
LCFSWIVACWRKNKDAYIIFETLTRSIKEW